MESPPTEMGEQGYALQMKWRGEPFPLILQSLDCVGDLKVLTTPFPLPSSCSSKEIIWSLTSVPPPRQKLLNLVRGQLPADFVTIESLLATQPRGKVKEFMMVGTPEGQEVMGSSTGTFAEESLDIDYSPGQIAAFKGAQMIRNERKLREGSETFSANMMHTPRLGKKLLVLDLDYCILDTALWKEGSNFNASHFARPFLHEFLSQISPFYDIVIWSQTSWKWLEQKLVELSILGTESAQDYPIVFVLDRKPMFSVYSEREGKPFKHEVKPLGIIWANYPNYSKENTIHVDDLARNFAMNPSNGLRVHAYKDSMNRRSTDTELKSVSKYLLQLAHGVADFSALDHKKFKSYMGPLPPGSLDPTARP